MDYNSLPELSRAEKVALLERAVEKTFDALGAPRNFEQQLAFDLKVDLMFAMSSCLLQQALRAQWCRLEDEFFLEQLELTEVADAT